MPLYVKVSKLTKGDVTGRFRGTIAEDLREVAALESELASDDRLISSSASFAIHIARFSSSVESSLSARSVVTDCGSRRGPRDEIDDLLGVRLASAESLCLDVETSCKIAVSLEGVTISAWESVGAVKLQERVVEDVCPRLFVSEYAADVSLPAVRGNR